LAQAIVWLKAIGFAVLVFKAVHISRWFL